MKIKLKKDEETLTAILGLKEEQFKEITDAIKSIEIKIEEVADGNGGHYAVLSKINNMDLPETHIFAILSLTMVRVVQLKDTLEYLLKR